MKVLVGVCSHEVQHVGSIRTAYRLKMRPEDRFADEWRFRGDIARESFVDALLRDDYFSDEDAILLLDGDQRHPEDMLETLREHMQAQGFDMLCAHYYARQTHTVHSLCYPVGDGTFPFMPYLDPPTEGFHELGWAGFGSVLIKKKVLKAVGALYPRGASPIGIGPLHEATGDSDNVGPDLRFFWNARKLGYKLWLDGSVESLHGVTIWLGHTSARKLIDYGDWADSNQELLQTRLELHPMSIEPFKQRLRILEARKRGLMAKLDEVRVNPALQKEAIELTIALHQMDGKILEMQAWVDMLTKHPDVTMPDDLPTTETMPKQETMQDGAELADVKKEREAAYQGNAMELINDLPNVK